MKSTSKPLFWVGCLGLAILLTGYILYFRDAPSYIYFMYAGIMACGIYWIWSIADISMANHLQYYQKMFWLIIAISVPVIGGFMYLLLHQERNKIVT